MRPTITDIFFITLLLTFGASAMATNLEKSIDEASKLDVIDLTELIDWAETRLVYLDNSNQDNKYDNSGSIILMGDYYPKGRTDLFFNKANGTPYMNQVMYPYAGAKYWKNDAERNMLQEKHYYHGDEKGWCLAATQPFAIWNDGAVREMGGISLYGQDVCVKTLAESQSNGAQYVRYVNMSRIVGLKWGAKFGNSVNSGFDGSYHIEVQVGGVKTGLAWSSSAVVKRYETFAPEYGVNKDTFLWGDTNTRAYHDVIEVLFYHGTSIDDLSTHDGFGMKRMIPGYASYAVKMWFAKGIGMIQQQVYMAETGSLGSYSDDAPKPHGESENTSYIDDLNSKW